MNQSANSVEVAPPSIGGPKIRVGFVITDLDVGGAERALVELVTRLPRDCFEARVWSLTDPADAARSLIPALAQARVPVSTLGATRWWDALPALRRLTAELRAWQPDLVQTFLFHANLLGRVAARRADVPRVVAGVRVAERRSRWRLRLDRWTSRMVDRWVCVSRDVAEFSQHEGALPAERLLVIPNGIDVARYEAAASTADVHLPTDRRWIIYVGRLDAQKGLEPFLSGAAAWLAELPRHDLLIVGDGPLRSTLEAMVAERCPPGRVRFTGWRTDVPALLQASDVLVLPSLWEGMPNVVLEAMAARRPVLASDVEGVRELLGDNASTQVAPPASPQWHQQLVRLASDRELALQLGAANRQRVEECFTIDAAAQAYAELYRSLLRQSALPPPIAVSRT